MSGKTKETFNAFDYVINITSSENFYLVQASNKFDWYGVLITGPNAATCSCKAGSLGLSCKHRKAVLTRWSYVSSWDDELTDAQWQIIKQRIEDEAEKDAYRTMIEAA